tara:strand:+ start:2017 stop:3003 length:987 start_codon:yes stop_codon:yes gene_type:complete
MAYQNVGTPRFYVNIIEWLDTLGSLSADIPEAIDNTFKTLPVTPSPYEWVSQNSVPLFEIPPVLNNQSFAAILGHNLNNANCWAACASTKSTTLTHQFNNHSNIVNWINPASTIPYDGFSLFSFDATGTTNIVFAINQTSNIGSIIIGTYFDMPHSPELKLTMTREMDGVKRVRTKGGSDLVDYKYLGSPLWGDNLAPWELGGSGANQKLARKGRRSWNLSFNYLSNSDVFPENSALTLFESDVYQGDYIMGGDPPEYTTNTILNSDSFYSQVIHKTNGGQLPFIFQPDSSNTNSDNWAICKFDMKSFKFSQQSPSSYRISLKIREVW